MPKPKPAHPPAEWSVSIPWSLASAVEARLPKRHGARAKLIQQLLREWLARDDSPFPKSGP